MSYIPESTRYNSMPYKKSGDSGLKLPLVSLGLWHNFGDTGNYENMKAMCFTAFDNGITHFDLANNYGPEYGSAERNFGKIIKEEFSAYRDELLISTKAGYDMWPGPYGNWGSRKYLIASLDQSLLRLGLPYVDIFYHHRMDPNTPLEETMGALASIVQSGKALYVGLSNYDGPTLEKASAILGDLHCPFIINQNRYSIFDRSIEDNGLKETANRLKKGIIAFSPLAQGLLTNRYLNGIPADSRIASDGRFLNENALTEDKLRQIHLLNDLAMERGQSLSQMALSWVLKDNQVTSVLIGASKPEQILDNIKIVGRTSFSEEELQRIDNIVFSNKKEEAPKSVSMPSMTACAEDERLPHYEKRYSYNKKGEKVDHFFRAWVMANVQASNDGLLVFNSRAVKEYEKFADELCLSDYQIGDDATKELLTKEWESFAEEYLLSCKESKDYRTTLFGFVTMSQEDVNLKILAECTRVTKEYPTALGLEELYHPLYLIMMAKADEILKS